MSEANIDRIESKLDTITDNVAILLERSSNQQAMISILNERVSTIELELSYLKLRESETRGARSLVKWVVATVIAGAGTLIGFLKYGGPS